MACNTVGTILVSHIIGQRYILVVIRKLILDLVYLAEHVNFWDFSHK